MSMEVFPPGGLASGGLVDVSDRAARQLGQVSPAPASTWDVSDRAGRLLGVLASIAAAVDVSDRAARALGVVASITAPVDVSDRAARALGVVASITAAVLVQPAPLLVEGKSAANTAVTLTLPLVAGQFHYITHIRLGRASTGALAGAATLDITTTNLGGLRWTVGNAMAAGATQVDVDEHHTHPLKSAVVATASTIVIPAAGLAVLGQGFVAYYTGP